MDVIQQAAVIPYRHVGDDGRIEIALITNRSGGSWIIPKGMIDPGEDAPTSAARECHEEAGLRGEVSEHPLGEYAYDKWGARCEVIVFAMRVTEELDSWDEVDFRTRRWYPLRDAAMTVRDPEVAELILSLAESL